MESIKRTIEDEHGNIIAVYRERNEQVTSISYSIRGGEIVFPIITQTNTQWIEGQDKMRIIRQIITVFYPIDILIGVLIFLKKSKNYKNI